MVSGFTPRASLCTSAYGNGQSVAFGYLSHNSRTPRQAMSRAVAEEQTGIDAAGSQRPRRAVSGLSGAQADSQREALAREKKARVRFSKAMRRHVKTLRELETAAKEFPWLLVSRSFDGQGSVCLSIASPPVKLDPLLPSSSLQVLKADSTGKAILMQGLPLQSREPMCLDDVNVKEIVEHIATPTSPCLGCGHAAAARFNVRASTGTPRLPPALPCQRCSSLTVSICLVIGLSIFRHAAF